MNRTIDRMQHSKEFPAIFHIEPTNICNQQCSMCPRDKIKRKEGFIKLDTVEKLVTEAKKYHMHPEIELYKDGEPLLHPQLFDMIWYASGEECITHINTNGVFLTEYVMRNLVQAGLTHLTISVLTSDQQKNLSIKHCDNFDTLKENISKLKIIRESLNSSTPVIRIKTLSTMYTPEFDKIWGEYADMIHVSKYHNWGGLLDTMRILHNKPCAYPWNNPVVNWDGDVSICCVDFNKQGVVGNIHDKTLYSIWHDAPIDKYRKDHLSGCLFAPCITCSQYEEVDKKWVW